MKMMQRRHSDLFHRSSDSPRSPHVNSTLRWESLSWPHVAKMASHAIFQYNVLAIDDTHNTWTNMIVKMNISRLLGSSDDKEKIGVARPEESKRPWRNQVKTIKKEAFCYHRLNRRRAKWTHRCNHREGLRARVWHRINRRWVFYTRRCIDLEYTRLGFYTGWTDAKEIAYVGALTDEDRGNSIHRLNRRLDFCERQCSCPESLFSDITGQLHSPV